MTNSVDVLIVGGGIAGLSLAMEFEREGTSYKLLEATNRPGGLCSSWFDGEGQSHDFGPHIFHNQDGFEWFRDLVPDCLSLPRQDLVQTLSGDLYEYPIQNSASHLIKPIEEIGEPSNYGEYCRKNYGTELSSEFFFPYNEKFYGTHITNISTKVTGRTPTRFSGAGMYLYPKSGSFSDLPMAMLHRIGMKNLRFCSPALYIDTKNKQVFTTDSVYKYNKLVWAAPLSILLDITNMKCDALDFVNLLLVTRKAKLSSVFLAKYQAGANCAHRVSQESTLKGKETDFIQEEYNVNKFPVDSVRGESVFILNQAYSLPTNRWISMQGRLEEEFKGMDIFLHGRAGRGIHMNIWPIVKSSEKLINVLYNM